MCIRDSPDIYVAKQGLDNLEMKLGDHLYLNPGEGNAVLDFHSASNYYGINFDIEYGDGTEDQLMIQNNSDSNDQTVYIHSQNQVTMDTDALAQQGISLTSSTENSWTMNIDSLSMDLTLQWVDHSITS